MTLGFEVFIRSKKRVNVYFRVSKSVTFATDNEAVSPHMVALQRADADLLSASWHPLMLA